MYKKVVLKMHVPKYFLLINLQSVALQLYQKRGSGTGVFLLVFQKSSEYFFLEHLRAAASVSFLLLFNDKINPLSLVIQLEADVKCN